ncbi:ABC transporter permease [Flexivirga oryzae]|uniref:ABC-2 type transport system permease protein n=1 Tax=Flexivirga oryzae TaxID=1794944 RepID=A0A839NIS0_9MICO|nr:ABC transporter permease [Flexivirga oryzae]MBB2894282.1 ABC-2 type transport system permease protein [Flexivirga oryzae]
MNSAILRLGMRSLFGRARVWLMIAMPVIMLALATLIRATSEGTMDDSGAEGFLRVFGIGIVVPVVALVATTTLINSEFDDGSIIYLLTKPVSRLTIISSKAVVVLAAGIVFAAVPMLLAGFLLVGGSSHVAVAAFAGGVVSTVAYVGIFTVLATTMKRSIVGCLLFWLLWESTISSLLSPVKWLSARAWGTAVIQHLATALGDGKPGVPLLYAVLGAVVAFAVGIALAGQRLASMTISEE